MSLKHTSSGLKGASPPSTCHQIWGFWTVGFWTIYVPYTCNWHIAVTCEIHAMAYVWRISWIHTYGIDIIQDIKHISEACNCIGTMCWKHFIDWYMWNMCGASCLRCTLNLYVHIGVTCKIRIVGQVQSIPSVHTYNMHVPNHIGSM